LAKRQNQIVKASLTLFLKKGFHATTMREISRESGINLGSLYDYVKNKQDVLNLIYDKTFLGVERFDKESLNSQSLKDFIRSYLSNIWTLYDKEVLVLYLNTFALEKGAIRKVLASESKHMDLLTERIGKWTKSSKHNEELVEIVAKLLAFMGAFHALRSWSIRDKGLKSVVDVATDMFTRILEQG